MTEEKDNLMQQARQAFADFLLAQQTIDHLETDQAKQVLGLACADKETLAAYEFQDWAARRLSSLAVKIDKLIKQESHSPQGL